MIGDAAPAAHVTTLDLAVIAAYFAATMAVGFAMTRRSRSVDGFTAAGRSLPDGAGQLLRVAGDHGTFSLGSLGPGLGEPTLWVVLLYGLTINLQNFRIDQNFVQRYIASKSDAKARESLWLGSLAGRLAQPVPRLPHHRPRHRSRAGRRPRRRLGAVGRIAQESPAMTSSPATRLVRTRTGAALLCALALAAPTRDARAPHPAIQVAETLNDNAPYPQCHASTIAEVTPGHLVAAWFGGTRESAPDVGIWVTMFESGRWSEPVEVATGAQPDGTRYPTWNPVLFAPPGQPLRLFYKVGPSPRAWWGIVKESVDGGRTWDDAVRLPSPLLGPIKNKPVLLADGAWLSPSSTEDSPTGWRAHVERSEDAGRTWTFIGPTDKGPLNLEAIQGSVLFHPGGLLQMVGRTRSGVVSSTWSPDGGRTWSPLEALGLPNPNAGTDAVTLRDGRHLIVYNDAAPLPGSRNGRRYPLVVALSPDGVTWTKAAVIEDDPLPDGYAYPAVIQTSNGLVHITYTWNRRRIRHVVLDPRLLQ